MKNLLCIVARTATGKDTLAKYLTSRYGLKPVVSYTTRPKRPSETEGVEHKFVSNYTAEQLLTNNKIAAYTKIGDYEYFALEEDVMNADYYIIDPKGVYNLMRKLPNINCIIAYLTASKATRTKRALNRGDALNVVQARLDAEDKQFTEFESKNMVNYTYKNEFGIPELKEFGDTLASVYRGIA